MKRLPDGEWLYIATPGGLRKARTGTWQEEPLDKKTISGFPALAPDSELLAIERGDGVIRLVEVADRKELALLQRAASAIRSLGPMQPPARTAR